MPLQLLLNFPISYANKFPNTNTIVLTDRPKFLHYELESKKDSSQEYCYKFPNGSKIYLVEDIETSDKICGFRGNLICLDKDNLTPDYFQYFVVPLLVSPMKKNLITPCFIYNLRTGRIV